MVDARDLKSLGGNPVRVRVPPSAPRNNLLKRTETGPIHRRCYVCTVSATEARQADRGRAACTPRAEVISARRGREMKTLSLVAVAALAATAAAADPLPVPKPPRPGGSCPHGYTTSGSFCVPSAGAQDAISKPPNGGSCPWGWLASGSFCLRSGPGRAARQRRLSEQSLHRTRRRRSKRPS
jgi:hypothetical protein